MPDRRLFTKYDCSVFSVGGESILAYLGRGEVRVSREWLENNALKDVWSTGAPGRAQVEVTVELAGDAGNTAHVFEFITRTETNPIELVITTDAGAIQGQFVATDATLTLEDAIREGATLRNYGAVTIS